MAYLDSRKADWESALQTAGPAERVGDEALVGGVEPHR